MDNYWQALLLDDPDYSQWSDELSEEAIEEYERKFKETDDKGLDPF